jgi:hypothetical protein
VAARACTLAANPYALAHTDTRPVPPNPAVKPLAVSFLYRFSSPYPVMNRYFQSRIVVIPYSPMRAAV